MWHIKPGKQSCILGTRKSKPIRFEIMHKDYSVLIQGRVDGVYECNRQTIIEEIKSVLRLQEEFRREDLPESYYSATKNLSLSLVSTS